MFIPLDFIIDKITNSIEEVASGKSFETIVMEIDWKEISKIHKKDGWHFNWKAEYKMPDRKVYKLSVINDLLIQGLISLMPDPEEKYFHLALIEVARHNFGKDKKFAGVASNLVAFACKLSYDIGFEGFVSFLAKTNLVEHYRQSLGAELIFGSQKMAIFPAMSEKLINSHYKNHINVK
jgi:hypothetical protein